jgi:hypothetical protein
MDSSDIYPLWLKMFQVAMAGVSIGVVLMGALAHWHIGQVCQ